MAREQLLEAGLDDRDRVALGPQLQNLAPLLVDQRLIAGDQRERGREVVVQ